jgi:hypothetical protein
MILSSASMKTKPALSGFSSGRVFAGDADLFVGG